MNFKNWLYYKVKRETSTGGFIPEIDGIRFFAIILVIFVHINTFLRVKSPYNFDYSGNLFNLFENGFKGVELFFVVSGFVLALPFAKHYLAGGKKPQLKQYLLRRLTRLEPPYFLALFIYFGLHLFKGVYPLKELVAGLIQNLLYIQNFQVFEHYRSIITVAWTLEIEVQFYLLAPILATVFKLSALRRRLVLISVIVLTPILNMFFVAKYLTLYNFIFYFLIGFLIADLYITQSKKQLKISTSLMIGLSSMVVFLYINIETIMNKYIFLVAIFLIVYLALNDSFWRKIFSFKLFTSIGGMCYTIYLFHMVIVTGIGSKTVTWRLSDNYELNILLQILLLLPPILAISAVYFVLIEKPCMDKTWPTKLRRFIASRALNFLPKRAKV